MTKFGDRLLEAMRTLGPLCVGIDPHPSLLADWGLPDTVDGLREFSLAVVDELAGTTAALKPQSAFFERHGSAGIAVLEEVLATARANEVITILDVKRGDIGSTMSGYAEAYLRPGASLEADSITLAPYLGPGSLEPAVRLAQEHGKGVFVLALTSNPEGAGVQHAITTSVEGTQRSVAATITDWVGERNRAAAQPAAVGPEAAARRGTAVGSQAAVGPVGLVVGATVGDAPTRLGIDLAGTRAILLAPGVGAQGAGPTDLPRVFGSALPYVLASVSRAVLRAGRGRMAGAASEIIAELQLSNGES